MGTTFRVKSRAEWAQDASPIEAINTGSLQRIADAVEKMAVRHTELINQRDYFERRAREEGAAAKSLQRRASAFQGVITRKDRELAGLRAAYADVSNELRALKDAAATAEQQP